MKRKERNFAASVPAGLSQFFRYSKLSLQDLLERYSAERLLCRLSRSPHFEPPPGANHSNQLRHVVRERRTCSLW
jgi:hypothetical protein